MRPTLLEHRTILVTGALGAIAEFVNRRLLEAGAEVILTDILEEEAARERLAQWKLPSGRWSYARMDVTQAAEVRETVSRIFAAKPGIDVLIGLAGGCALHPFEATSPEEYDRIFTFNYYGQLYPTRAVLEEWTRRSMAGQIIYTTSLVARLPWKDLSAYITAKAGVESLAKCLALEYAAKGVRFNCVAPGHVAAGSSLKVYESDPVYREMVDRVIPLRRLVRPESIADAFVYLCSEMGQDVNGQVLAVDCGASIPQVG